MIAELKPINDSHKSFYGKAIVAINDNIITLYSYNIKICSIVNKCQFIRYWNGYSATTNRHIAEFCLQNGFTPYSKKEWENLPVAN